MIRTPAALFVLTAALFAQETRPKDDIIWKGGAPVPADAVASVNGVLSVSIAAFADEITRRFLRPDLPGAKVLENLVSEALVMQSAEKAGVEVSDADVQARFDDLAAQMRRADPKLDLATKIKEQGVSMETFRKKLRSLCLLDRLARIDQRIPDSLPVETKHHNTWLVNRRNGAKIEIDPAKLPDGAAATVDGAIISERAFVRDFLQTADPGEIRRNVDMLARLALMEDALTLHKLVLDDADLDLEFAARKADFESKPQYVGIKFDEIVKQQTGLEPEQWKRTRGFRLEAGYSKLGRGAGKDEVQEYYETHLGLFGPRFTVKHLLIRGSDDADAKTRGDGPVPPLAKARAQIATIVEELKRGKRFEDLAQLYSEDVATKLSGGALEPFVSAEKRLHASFSDAVERLEVGQVSGAVETPAGVHLIKLEKKDPPPPLERVESPIRRELGLKRFRELWAAATYGVDVKVD